MKFISFNEDEYKVDLEQINFVGPHLMWVDNIIINHNQTISKKVLLPSKTFEEQKKKLEELRGKNVLITLNWKALVEIWGYEDEDFPYLDEEDILLEGKIEKIDEGILLHLKENGENIVIPIHYIDIIEIDGGSGGKFEVTKKSES